jgi:hypothetical protein
VGVPADTVAPRIKSLKAEKLSVAEQLDAATDKKKVVTVHPAAIKNYLAAYLGHGVLGSRLDSRVA